MSGQFLRDDRRTSAVREHRCLDWLNFSVAAVQTGFGPFVGVYLIGHGWTQTDIGVVLSIGAVAAMASQLPAGALVDAAASKITMAVLGLGGVGASALMLAIWPAWLPVMAVQILHAFASSMLGPAIASISLALMGHDRLGERLGHNTRYASIGNASAAVALGALGYYASERSVFVLAAGLMLPGFVALYMMRPRNFQPAATSGGRVAPIALKLHVDAIWPTFRGPGFLAFGACSAAFYLSSAAMLPLAANAMTEHVGHVANLIISASIVVEQLVVALVSPWVGRAADRSGRRPLLLLGCAVVPIRGLLLAASSPLVLVMAQALDGISSAVFGVMVPLVAADLTRRRGCFNLCMGAIGLAIGLGASLSTTVSGMIADQFGTRIAFLSLGLMGLAAFAILALVMPETAPHQGRPADKIAPPFHRPSDEGLPRNAPADCSPVPNFHMSSARRLLARYATGRVAAAARHSAGKERDK